LKWLANLPNTTNTTNTTKKTNKTKAKMLQRIQSIYLLLAGLVIFLLFLFPMVHNVYVNGIPSTISVTGVYQDVNGQQTHTQSFIALIAATAVVGIMPLLLIFQYKNRKQQINLCYVYILVVIGYSFWIAQTVKGLAGDVTLNTNNFGIGALLSSVSILLTILAFKAIQRDEKLVKSADRLR
jgi:uncharacterized membrane protein HdeD (DUF308 family)